MAIESAGDLTLLSFDNPVPDKCIYSQDRDHNLSVIQEYVIDGQYLEAEAVNDMVENPEALSLQIVALEGWLSAAAAGESGL